ncbi:MULTISPECIES: ROK family protein [Helcococcus]|uniref:ROK family protein n=1 Tax=Helcococcus bovis TaxID=3153252 RepID=A0ABW9F5L7_9FIRM
MYLIFDIGGSSTKIGIIKDKEIIKKCSIDRINTLEEFLLMLEEQVQKNIYSYNIKGIGFSSPGTVDSKTGNIYGLSAIDYIHEYNFAKHIQDKFNLPVAIENDANCAALAQMFMDTPKEKDIAFVIVGTGIGGAIIKDKEIIRGRRLEAGEFGYMLLKNIEGEYTNFSRLATIPNVVSRIKEKYNIVEKPHIVLEKYFNKIEPFYSEVRKMFQYMCMGLYNIQYIYDPELIYIGGGISQSEKYIEELKNFLQQEPFKLADVKIRPVTFYNDNNLYGAYSNLLKSIEKGARL